MGGLVAETCGNCNYWDTTGFGLRYGPKPGVVYPSAWKVALVGQCRLVAKHWFPESPDKPISLIGTEHTRYPVSELIAVVTRREFGSNQFQPVLK
ncbi:MAG: hypothetical protein A3A13_02075 [Candidatus Yanofskybacteria bacterium RIFCSPLOWO2_01_FULL_43_22]|uniref:Uncharacterized protein n=1 Tax=Candidatus Yanofskybacteria bacterium RIFCSPLOWO2_01_FULL_43_22 TaxID=1802695 RepID=A0A1F8GEP8_9BACT|nr:MAG: hypothetical protein A3D48_00995 [Candidatus Yanofskybacteria bacterium RIFCSPHIGHO2_02_FULL_43_17]OGN23857.1 MAG: hypothetical protein A3A13_02075 [Candidatus Yanofskybacteria bacterium RIFCSPLOWO2_01_FULL_43_22]